MEKSYNFLYRSNVSGRQKYTVEEYVARINKVIDYIKQNLSEELRLDKLAEIANFSPFHFHRIFGAMLGETINQFVVRNRLEKAASTLVGNPKKSITEIAYDCGFSGSTSFARVFKEKFGMSASDWREGGYIEFSKNRKTDSKNGKSIDKDGKASENSDSYIADVIDDIFQKERILAMGDKKIIEGKVKIEELDTMTVAYVRHIGPYAGDGELFGRLFGKLYQWAGPRGLINFPETKSMSVYHDDPKITDEDKLIVDVCLTVPTDTKVDGEISKMEIKGGKYAVAEFELLTEEYSHAWNYVFGKWMPESGYEPADGVSFEVYKNDPKEHPEGKCIVDICVPVKPM